jgi:amphiphysin
VIRPSLELQEIIKTIQKTIVKRNHKLIDYDRHRVSLNKLNAKAERSLSEEKNIYKVQSQLDTATQDYEYLNNALKSQLPVFFQMLFQFIQPIFEHLYHLQNKIFGLIYARCYELVTTNEQYFVTHAMDIEAGYNWRKQQFDAQAEIQNMDLLKSGGKAWLSGMCILKSNINCD